MKIVVCRRMKIVNELVCSKKIRRIHICYDVMMNYQIQGASSSHVLSAGATVRTTFPHTVSIYVAIIKPGKMHNFPMLKWIQLIERNYSLSNIPYLTQFLF
jgi:hypothetical protein